MRYLALLLLTAVSLPALASPTDLAGLVASGGVDSGGGKSIVCRNGSGAIISATLLDLFEGKVLFAREPLASGERFEVQFHAAAERIWKATGFAQAAYLEYLYSDGMQMFGRATFLPRNIKLGPTDDAVQVIVPNGCQLEQAAAFNTRLERLIVDSEIWEALDETNRAALLLHETLYDDFRRNADERDSFYTRQVVSYAMSLGELHPVSDGISADAYFCQANSDSGQQVGKHAFYLYESPDKQFWNFRWTMVNRLPLFTSSTEVMMYNPSFGFTFDQLVGFKEYSGPSFKSRWVAAPSLGSPINVGWVGEMEASFQQLSPGFIQLNVGFHRPGETGESMAMYTVHCWRPHP